MTRFRGTADSPQPNTPKPPIPKLKRALVAMMDDNFYVGYDVFLKSFLHFNPWFTDDFAIIDVGLSVETRQKMVERYARTVFVKPIYDNYKLVNMKHTAKHLQKTFYTLDVFALPYDRAIFIDMDTVILGDLSTLFDFPGQFGAVRQYNRNMDRLTHGFNSGVFVVNSPALSLATYQRLLQIASPGHSMPDQAVLNQHFAGRMHYFDKIYNVEKRMLHTKLHTKTLENARILHFVGEKPWETHSSWHLEAKYEPLEAIWREWRDK